MSFIKETMFEVAIPDGLKNTSGKFGKIEGDKLVSDDCSAGLLCVKHSLTDNEGYEEVGYKNGNDWNFVAAADGNAGNATGDHTGIFSFNNYDRNSAIDANGNRWLEGRNTLGIGLPAGERGDFRELLIGKQYKYGKGNFKTAPADDTHKYAKIQDGRFVATATEPTAADGVYFKILRKVNVTEGPFNWGEGYIVTPCRKANTAAVSGGTEA